MAFEKIGTLATAAAIAVSAATPALAEEPPRTTTPKEKVTACLSVDGMTATYQLNHPFASTHAEVTHLIETSRTALASKCTIKYLVVTTQPTTPAELHTAANFAREAGDSTTGVLQIGEQKKLISGAEGVFFGIKCNKNAQLSIIAARGLPHCPKE